MMIRVGGITNTCVAKPHEHIYRIFFLGSYVQLIFQVLYSKLSKWQESTQIRKPSWTRN